VPTDFKKLEGTLISRIRNFPASDYLSLKLHLLNTFCSIPKVFPLLEVRLSPKEDAFASYIFPTGPFYQVDDTFSQLTLLPPLRLYPGWIRLPTHWIYIYPYT